MIPMQIAFFSTKPYDRRFFDQANQSLDVPQDLVYFEARLTPLTAKLANGFPVLCSFVNDHLSGETMEILASGGTQLLALRCAGFNQVDLPAAAELGLKIVRVPNYSPYSVAEHAVGLILMLNRKLYRAYNRVREDNFTLDGLLGFDLRGSTVGIIGTGKIGMIFARIMQGFGCRLLGYDAYPNSDFESLEDARYVSLADLYAQSDIISLHCPLTPETHYLINSTAIEQMKPGVMLINTSRGHLIDTEAAIAGIKTGRIGYLGLDVYEQEGEIFFEDWSEGIILDDTFQLLQSFPNVVITAHQAFFTRNALSSIAQTTLDSVREFALNQPLTHEVKLAVDLPVNHS